MKEIFEQLNQRLVDNCDHYVYEDVDGDINFCMNSLLAEVRAFASEFEKGLQ